MDCSTFQDWREIWNRELIEQPPADAWFSAYFGHSPPSTASSGDDGEEEVVFDVSDCEV